MTAPAAREYAGAVSRSIAYALDAVIVTLVYSGGVLIAMLIAAFIGSRTRELAHAVAVSYLLILPALLAIYCALFWALAGRTPGMAVLGLRVVASRERPLSWLSALIRALVLAYFPLGAAWALVDARHQAIHDKLARTLVIRVPVPTPAGSTARGTPPFG
ncbi:hypothetical protein Adi01nite_07930 [Amorphoplanes digitatis]|uniref:RDD family protein n=1 Tax=Actinoplanes digitatis TaxID=1868 RepID=UPI00161FB6B0|nr:RDD family protein [Actinoplanes digitatis]GID91381.1 hypothetical protein Adi01nite_07930 [Actinoplanes digitatis]